MNSPHRFGAEHRLDFASVELRKAYTIGDAIMLGCWNPINARS
jgi:hypothetical protein